MRNFRELEIWRKGMNATLKVYHLTTSLPDTEKFGLTSQMRRSAVSIPSNIAEGCSRDSQKDFKRFLEISLGSSFELETQVLLCNALSYLNNQQRDEIVTELHSLQKQINSLIKKINQTLQ